MPPIPEALLPFVVLSPVVLLILGLTIGMRLKRSGAPGRIAGIYPPVAPMPGTRMHRDRAVFGRGYSSMAWVKVGVDREHLHMGVGTSWQNVASFSVPLGDITPTPDSYGWMVLAPDTVRLTLARAPDELLMIFLADFEKLARASEGHLRLAPVPPPPPIVPKASDRPASTAGRES